MSTINERIELLENKIVELEAKLGAVSSNTEGASKTNYTIVGASKDPNISRPIIWNNTEINAAYGTQPATPKFGYNKHSHSRFAGGALIYGVIEIVDYDWGAVTNKQSQSYLEELPIVKEKSLTTGLAVDRIGTLDLVFNPDGGFDADGKPIGTWGCPSYEINVTKCFLVERVTAVDSNNPTIGAIKKDSKQHEMKSLLYNSDTTKSSVVWDENGQCWRFYAVFAPVPTP
jgi:hypothetical protein